MKFRYPAIQPQWPKVKYVVDNTVKNLEEKELKARLSMKIS